MLNLINASKTKNSFILTNFLTKQIFDLIMHVFTTVSTFLLKQYCYWAGFKRTEKGNKPIVFWASYYGENAFFGCRILCWFKLLAGNRASIASFCKKFNHNLSMWTSLYYGKFSWFHENVSNIIQFLSSIIRTTL